MISAPGVGVAPSIKDAADEVHTLVGPFEPNRKAICSLQIDVLIYADINSEPSSYFFSYGRLAPYQLLFWGNPVTSGVPNIDYFITADIMEGENVLSRYTEQPLLLEGQGIFYDEYVFKVDRHDQEAPSSNGRVIYVDSNFSREKFGFDVDWIIYICPQKVFKLHPTFDEAIHRILVESDKFHLILLEGTYDNWTHQIKSRLRRNLAESVYNRIHFLPTVRQESEFLSLIAIADIVLHTFPFGGSKTSLDGLVTFRPVVALATEQLRCRMAMSYYVTMNLMEEVGCCVTYSVNDYVALAVRLGEYRLLSFFPTIS